MSATEPLAVNAAPPVAAHAAPHCTLPEPPQDPARTILLAEDDRAIRRYLQVILERAGYTVVVASDGLEAMKAALSVPVAAVVTDAIMPHLGGHELTRFLRRHPRLKGLPVILLSGTDQSAPPAGAEERADLYLSKPVRPEEFTRSVGRLLEQAR